MQATASGASQNLGVSQSLDVLRRHPDLWFTDGSIILHAEDSIFRVHMSQLSRHSAFFRDMFSLPQPVRQGGSNASSQAQTGSDGDTFEGCPVLDLHDPADDLANLLKALYDGPTFGNNDQDDFRIVSGILRLSTKYIIDTLRAKAIAHLSIAWPLTLRGWEAREDLSRIYEMESQSRNDHLYPSPIAVINLARDVNAPSLLPSAFYDLSRYTYAQIYEPCEDELLHPSHSLNSSLSPHDMRQLSLGKEESHQVITDLIQSMGNSPHRDYYHPSSSRVSSSSRRVSSSRVMAKGVGHQRTGSGSRSGSRLSCVSAAACRKDFTELVDLATQHYLMDKERGHSDPLYVAEELGQLKSAELGSDCKACARSLEAWADRERERIWRLIPTWFRLDGGLQG
ncbi:hypothetical protein JAAARDRAFT_199963 [Jaapia argillacea MUCL 33604]|uniref:BTB domain-containing protein n=1 Tax=Jaapia argillacea MUCL 33604 TaxID=933084 RepID=A0A067PHC6_9AGAM|nr:hypothetical protein JAAARDRAFT_199963 [Jaapia argillacea MUCL 33604]